jgi:hypothetical protein
MKTKLTYSLDVRLADGGGIVSYQSDQPFQAFNIGDTLAAPAGSHPDAIFRVAKIHHVLHEAPGDLLHSVVLGVEATK